MADSSLRPYSSGALTQCSTGRRFPPTCTSVFMGGAGFGVKLLYDLVRPGLDPLGPENVLRRYFHLGDHCPICAPAYYLGAKREVVF